MERVCPLSRDGCGEFYEDRASWREDQDEFCNCGEFTIPVKDACVTDFTDKELAEEYAGFNIPSGRSTTQP